LTPPNPAPKLYERDYRGRGEMENGIKKQQLHLFAADRTRAATMRANQIRLFFSSIAYTLLEALRRLGLTGTLMGWTQCQTIRLRLLKIGALVKEALRRWLRVRSPRRQGDSEPPNWAKGFSVATSAVRETRIGVLQRAGASMKPKLAESVQSELYSEK
jgi:hypothetical protein